MSDPIKPIEVTEQIPVLMPRPSVPRPELFVVESWCEIDKAWSGTIARTPDRAQYLANIWKTADIFRIPGEAERKEKDRLFAAAPEMLEALRAFVKAWDHADLSEISGAVKKAQDAIAKAEEGA